MSEFNLIDEPFISVVTDYKGTTKLVGLKEFFKDAHTYIDFAGDTKTQDFAVMRFLLAILHTVFSRYDAFGNPYEMIELNDRMQQIQKVELEDEEEYEDALMETWENLWRAEKFPDIVVKYLEVWRDRFYLFDDKYPFYQVTKEEVDASKLNKDNPSEISGKNINRLISESGNKISIFSPKYDNDKNKEILSYDELIRWIITYQSYSGLSDKVIFGEDKYKASKGWLFDLGGVYLSGDNLYKTLALNLQLKSFSQSEFNFSIQKPCWEYSPSEVIDKYFMSNGVDNIAELYTNWSRAIYIEKYNPNKPFSMRVVKLPEIKHDNQFLEPMTVWKYNESGDNKGKFTPKKHQLNKSMWRSFGLITKNESGNEGSVNNPNRKPGIIEWLNNIDKYIKNERVKIHAVSMEDDGNATSWVPTNEVIDDISIDKSILNDIKDDGWVYRINDIVEDTKEIIDKIYRGFINDIKKIRNIESKTFTDNIIGKLYFEIDKPFRDWLSGIKYDDNKDDKSKEWKKTLKDIVILNAKTMLKNSTSRDITGIIKKGSVKNSVKNIFTAFNHFTKRMNKKI